MAFAKQCDRCGSFYPTKDDPRHRTNCYLLRAYSKCNGEDIDLCPECYKKLEKFMKGKEIDEN